MDLQAVKELIKLENEHWWFNAREQIILKMIRRFCKFDKNHLDIFDIGCGTGKLLNNMAREFKFTSVPYGLEASQYMIDHVINGNGLKIYKGEFPDKIPPPIANKTFDLITLFDVLEHLDDDDISLKCISELLKPKGYILITVPAYQFLWSHHDEINHHKRRYERSLLSKRVRDAGFVIKKISYFNTLLFPGILVSRLLSKLGDNNNFDLKNHSKITNYLLFKIFLFEKYLLGYINFPFGLSLVCIAQKKYE